MTATKLLKAICVWLDDASDYDNPKWIVSRDTLYPDGRAESTETLSVHDEADEAMLEARREGRRLDLPVYTNPPDNPPELIQPDSTGRYHYEDER